MLASKKEEKLSRTQELNTAKIQALRELGYTKIDERNASEVLDKIAEIMAQKFQFTSPTLILAKKQGSNRIKSNDNSKEFKIIQINDYTFKINYNYYLQLILLYT